MIGKSIKLSRESERQGLIQQLNCYGIHEGSKGEQLSSLDYFTLLSMLAVKKAVES